VGGETILKNTLNVATSATFDGEIIARSAVTLSPANANVTISPDNGGTVTIFPTSVGSINNIRIGAISANSGRFTNIDIISDIPSTGLGVGALIVEGGASIARDLYVGGTIFGRFQGESIVSATVVLSIGAGIPGQVLYQEAPGVTGFTNQGTTGSVLVSYGAGEPLFQNFLNLASTTSATSTTTGALTVVGGVGIGGDLQIGGKVTIGGIPLLSLISGNPWKIITNTSTYLASTGDRLMMSTTVTSVTITLPITPSIGDYIQFLDYGETFSIRPATIARNNERIMGLAEDLIIDISKAANTLIYSDRSQGWKLGAII
jgi:hypothetical protein